MNMANSSAAEFLSSARDPQSASEVQPGLERGTSVSPHHIASNVSLHHSRSSGTNTLSERFGESGARVHRDLAHERRSSTSSSDHNSDAASLRDSLGNYPYKRVFPRPSDGEGQGGDDNELLPLELRNAHHHSPVFAYFSVLTRPHFWFLVEYAARTTFIAMLVPAALIYANLPHSPFISQSFALASAVITSGTTVGQSAGLLYQYLKAGCIWLPVVTACVALRLNNNLVVWFVVYAIITFLLGVFTTNFTRRIGLLLFNVCYVGLLSGNTSLAFPSRVFVDWLLGALFSLASTLIPYPELATSAAARLSTQTFKNTATCFAGILECFWAPSNTERSMFMVRIRYLVRSIDTVITQMESCDAFTQFELLIFEPYEEWLVRQDKVKLLYRLKMSLRTMERVINILQDRPQLLDQSERALLFGRHLSATMESIIGTMEALLGGISKAKEYKDLLDLSPQYEAAGCSIKRLQDAFDVARRVILYESDYVFGVDRLEEYIPLMNFFVFAVANFWVTLQDFQSQTEKQQPIEAVRESFRWLWKGLKDPFVENGMLVWYLLTRRNEQDLRNIIEAAKTAAAMLISVIFFYYVDNQELLLSGPTIVAFVSGTNPVEALQASAARMTGTLLGSVVGFFASTLCRNNVDRVVALCTTCFFMSFLRPGQRFGSICMYCNFVVVSSITDLTADSTVSRIQQNTFAIFIYCFICIVVFPVSPHGVLLEKRLSVIQQITMTVRKLVGLLEEAAKGYQVTHRGGTEALARGGGSMGGSEVKAASSPPEPAGVRPYHHFPKGVRGTSIVKSRMSENNSTTRGSETPPMSIDRFNERLFRLNNLRGDSILAHAFVMAPEDTRMEDIFRDTFKLLSDMQATASIMPLAAGEVSLVPREYPQRASTEVHAAMHRLCALVYAMACSWQAMRRKGYFTEEVTHIFHNLTPISMDIAQCLEHFTVLLAFYVKHPSSGLSSELTTGVMQLRSLCIDICVRKERCFLSIIRQTIERNLHNNNHSKQTRPSPPPDHRHRTPPVAPTTRGVAHEPVDGSGGVALSEPFPSSLPFSDRKGHPASHSSHEQFVPSIEATPLPEPTSPPPRANARKDTIRRSGARARRGAGGADSSKVILPLARPRAPATDPQQQPQPPQSAADTSCLTPSPCDTVRICYNESFTTPVTVADAEGLHSFTLALDMFSRELRKVLLGFEEMLQAQA